MPQLKEPSSIALSQKLREVMLHITSQRFGEVNKHLAFLLDTCREALAVNRVGLWLFERGGQRIRLKQRSDDGTIRHVTPDFIERDDCPTYFATLQSNFCVDVADAKRDPRTAELSASYLQPAGIQSMLDLPVRSLGTQIGVLCIEHASEQREWHLLEQSFANGVATQISLTLERDELEQANSSIIRRVLFDQLTGLPNYLHLNDSLEQALGDLASGGKGVGLVYADVEQFLLICNSLGQALAQALLVSLAARLRAVAGADIFVARAGDDDFALILRADAPLASAKALCERLLLAMREPLDAKGREVLCTLSLGYTARIASDSERTSEALLREGWSASRAARSSGEPHVFERAQLVRAALEVELEQELRKAIRDGQFEPHLQPIFNIEKRAIIGFEALLRWRQPQRGIITPVEFMGVAQRTGLIVPIGQQLLKVTLHEFAKIIKQQRHRELTLYFNMSPPEFLRDSLLQEIAAELELNELLPKHLALEITESVMIEDMRKAQTVIIALHQLGVGVHLDDLGTGYSSLNYLRVLPVDGIKLDYSFTHDIERNYRSSAMVKSLSNLSVALNQDAIAEGVEWEGQLAQLWLCGVKLIQGYLLARPTPIAEITAEWINQIEAHACALFDKMELWHK
jgi:diguanylate cyclase